MPVYVSEQAKQTADLMRQLCVPENKLRETYFGTSYRAAFALGSGQKQEWDILHIQVPFSPEKEARLMQRFQLTRAELPAFYKKFSAGVKRGAAISNTIRTDATESTLRCIRGIASQYSTPIKDDKGQTIGVNAYIVQEPAAAFTGTSALSDEGVTLKTLINLALRLLQTIKYFAADGYALGRIDLDQCFVRRDTETGKDLFQISWLNYCGKIGTKIEHAKDASGFVYPDVASGELGQDTNTDVYMLCSLLWTMLDGRHYGETANWSAVPKYADPEMASMIRTAMTTGASGMKALNTGLRAYLKKMSGGEVKDVFIPFAEPEYLSRPMPELRSEHKPEYAASALEEEEDEEEKPGGFRAFLKKLVPKMSPPDDEDGESEPEEPESDTPDDEEESDEKPKKKRWLLLPIILIVLASLVFLAYSYMMDATYIQWLKLPHASPSPTVQVTALVSPTPHSSTPAPAKSGADGIYVHDGRVVDASNVLLSLYKLDDNGNICYAKSDMGETPAYMEGDVLYTADRVSPYIPIESLQIQMISRSYIPAEKQTLFAFYDGVIDARETDFVFKPDDDGAMVISAKTVKKNGWTEGSTLIATAIKIVANEMEDGRIERAEEMDDKPAVLELTAGEEGALIAKKAKDQNVSSLYRAEGDWIISCLITANPSQVTNRYLTVNCENQDMWFVGSSDAAVSSLALELNSAGQTVLSMQSKLEGSYMFSITSDGGETKSMFALTFDTVMDDTSSPLMTPAPTPTPEPTPTPVPTPEPIPSFASVGTINLRKGDSVDLDKSVSHAYRITQITPLDQDVIEVVKESSDSPTMIVARNVGECVITVVCIDEGYNGILKGQTLNITVSVSKK